MDSIAIIATEQSYIFAMRCEATGTWLKRKRSSGYSNEAKIAEMRETLKKSEYQFHKAVEECCSLWNTEPVLWITAPVGFWLNDGRLVAPAYEACRSIHKRWEQIIPYYGTQSEILRMGRSIQYIKT